MDCRGSVSKAAGHLVGLMIMNHSRASLQGRDGLFSINDGTSIRE